VKTKESISDPVRRPEAFVFGDIKPFDTFSEPSIGFEFSEEADMPNYPIENPLLDREVSTESKIRFDNQTSSFEQFYASENSNEMIVE